jgi:hypothetical protein
MYFDIFSSQSRSPSSRSKWLEKNDYNFEGAFDDDEVDDDAENIPVSARIQNASPANNYGEMNGALYKAIEKRDERIKELEMSLLRFEQTKSYVDILSVRFSLVRGFQAREKELIEDNYRLSNALQVKTQQLDLRTKQLKELYNVNEQLIDLSEHYEDLETKNRFVSISSVSSCFAHLQRITSHQ